MSTASEYQRDDTHARPTGRRGVKQFIKGAITGSLRALPFGMFRMLTGPDLLVACYHAAVDEVPSHLKHVLPCRSAALFKQDLEFFTRRYRPVGLQDVLDHALHGKRLPKHALLLTIDDGLREVQDVMTPICQSVGIPATLFLTGDALEQKQLLYRHKASLLVEAIESQGAAKAGVSPEEILAIEYPRAHILDELAVRLGVDFDGYLKTKKPYLDAEQVRRLIAQGFTIGGHSVDHPRYALLPLEEQVRQTHLSITLLQQLFAINYRAFAFPFMSDGVGADFFDRLFSEKTADVVFCIGEIARPSPRTIPRVWMEISRIQPIEAVIREVSTASFFARRRG